MELIPERPDRTHGTCVHQAVCRMYSGLACGNTPPPLTSTLTLILTNHVLGQAEISDVVGTHLTVGREPYRLLHRQKRSYNKLESECRSKGWCVIPLYVEVAALGHINTTWGMMRKAMGMDRVSG